MDDRVEMPEGTTIDIKVPDHPILKDIDLTAKKGITVLDTDSIQIENVRVEQE